MPDRKTGVLTLKKWKMHWSGVNQSRTTAISRNRAKNLFEKGLALHCVWSGRKLVIDKLH